jgi:phosphonate transport system permease protein
MAGGTATRDVDLGWERLDSRARLVRYVLWLLAGVTLIASWSFLDMRLGYLVTAPRNLADLFGRMVPPDVTYTSTIVEPMIPTINIAIVGTLFAILTSFPVAFLAASNTTPSKLTYVLGKFIISASRSINGIIWGLITVIMFGPGALAGMVAVGLRSIGFVSKLLGEEIEEIDRGAVEAVEATGANTFLRFLWGIFPQIKPALVGISIYRWDINVRISTVIGFVGAGGIGIELFRAINAFAWQSVLTILIAILGVVIVSEALSAYLRAKVR